MSLEFRQMEVGDFDSLLPLWSSVEGLSLERMRDRDCLAGYLSRNPGYSRVAVVGSDLVAALLCGHDGMCGYMYHLAVRPDWRRKGLATAMVGDCLLRLARDGIDSCAIVVGDANRAARSFWSSLGWRRRDNASALYCVDVGRR